MNWELLGELFGLIFWIIVIERIYHYYKKRKKNGKRKT